MSLSIEDENLPFEMVEYGCGECGCYFYVIGKGWGILKCPECGTSIEPNGNLTINDINVES